MRALYFFNNLTSLNNDPPESLSALAMLGLIMTVEGRYSVKEGC